MVLTQEQNGLYRPKMTKSQNLLADRIDDIVDFSAIHRNPLAGENGSNFFSTQRHHFSNLRTNVGMLCKLSQFPANR